MKSRTRTAAELSKFLVLVLFLTLAPAALASRTWYVDGVNGNDSNDCLSSQTGCQTIGHAISLCSSGDSIMVAPATYTENLTIDRSLKIIGADAATTVVDGNHAGSVFTIKAKAHVYLSNLTISNGSGRYGGGIHLSHTYGKKLTINNSIISGNVATGPGGGGIFSFGCDLTINKSTITANSTSRGEGGGIYADGTLTINKSTISGNSAASGGGGIFTDGNLTINNSTIGGNGAGQGWGGGILNMSGTLTITNSAVSGNVAALGGGIFNVGSSTITNSTISNNDAGMDGGGIHSDFQYATIQNSIVANNRGGNCSGAVISNGYNLSSDNTCNFTGSGDMNNTDPKLGKLGNWGGPTQTIILHKGSPAIDAGNPNGCTDDKGNLLKTDQRGWRRPGKHDTGGCDIGAFEVQHD